MFYDYKKIKYVPARLSKAAIHRYSKDNVREGKGKFLGEN